MSKFQSTSFYLAQWANKSAPVPNPNKRDPVLIDIVENHTSRRICVGNTCGLYYESKDKMYQTVGDCKRNTLCTEMRIIKDKLYLKSGSESNTAKCIDYPSQLKSWNN